MGWLTAAACLVLAAWAARAEAQIASAASQVWLVPLVGLLLATASWAMRGPLVPRILLVLAAGTWLSGSFSPWLLLAHQGVFVLVLLTAGSGRLQGWDRLVAALSVPIALGMLEQLALGVVFVCVGVRVLLRRTPASYGAASAGALVGGTLIGAWLLSRVDPLAFDPYSALLVYEGALVAAAFALVLGSRADVTRRRAMVDRLVADAGSAGSTRLSQVLAEVLRAPGLKIIHPPITPDPGLDLPVEVEGRLLAVVRHPSVVALEAAARNDVAAAVRLVLLGEERRAALDVQAVALKEAQRRMVTAQDQQRADTGAKLRSAVVAPLWAAAAILDDEVSRGDPETSAAIGVALTQIRATTADVEELVHGAGAVGLGQGRLVDAVRAMARRSPVPVEVRVEGMVAASEEVERALYYVCAEALVNVHRHARASAATAMLASSEGMVRARISDDGVGGADVGRPGLSGLAERVAMLGGRLRVESPPGAGTILYAELPSS
jgi:signal transduction histidine kinase